MPRLPKKEMPDCLGGTSYCAELRCGKGQEGKELMKEELSIMKSNSEMSTMESWACFVKLPKKTQTHSIPFLMKTPTKPGPIETCRSADNF